MPGLDIIVGVALDWWGDGAGTVLCAGLLCVTLTNAGCVVVGHDHDLLGCAVHLAQLSCDGNQVAGAVRHDDGAVGCFVDGCRGGEAFGYIQCARLIQ